MKIILEWKDIRKLVLDGLGERGIEIPVNDEYGLEQADVRLVPAADGFITIEIMVD